MLNESGTLKEGDYVQFNCSSDGGNPTPTIRWLRGDQNIIGNPAVPPSDKFGTTWSTYIRQLDRTDHNMKYGCLVENKAILNQPKWTNKTLQVQCK